MSVFQKSKFSGILEGIRCTSGTDFWRELELYCSDFWIKRAQFYEFQLDSTEIWTLSSLHRNNGYFYKLLRSSLLA